MKLDEACVEALKILKQVMEEKLTSTNIEVSLWTRTLSEQKVLTVIKLLDTDTPA